MKSNPLPLVSVGVASFNNAPYLVHTLESIRTQDYSNWELIIVDDCSTDDSVLIVQKWLEEHSRINARLIVNSRNQGVCRVLNMFLAEARGEFISVIGSDDIYMPNKLSLQVKALSRLDDDYAMCYSDIIRINAEGEVLDQEEVVTWPQGKPEGFVMKELIKGNFIPAMSVLIRAPVLKKLNGFDEALSFEDWDMWLRIAREYKIKYVPIIAAKYRVHGKSAMSTRMQTLLESCLLLLSKHLDIDTTTDSLIHSKMSKLAQELYMSGSPKAKTWLMRTLRLQPNLRSIIYIILASLHISYEQAFQVGKYFTGFTFSNQN